MMKMIPRWDELLNLAKCKITWQMVGQLFVTKYFLSSRKIKIIQGQCNSEYKELKVLGPKMTSEFFRRIQIVISLICHKQSYCCNSRSCPPISKFGEDESAFLDTWASIFSQRLKAKHFVEGPWTNPRMDLDVCWESKVRVFLESDEQLL